METGCDNTCTQHGAHAILTLLQSEGGSFGASRHLHPQTVLLLSPEIVGLQQSNQNKHGHIPAILLPSLPVI